MPLLSLQVTRTYDGFIKPPGPKRIVCICPEEGYFFRINSENKWPCPVRLDYSDCHGFLDYHSFLQCDRILEFSDYIIDESIESVGILGTVPKIYAAQICDAADKSFNINPVDKAIIRRVLGC